MQEFVDFSKCRSLQEFVTGMATLFIYKIENNCADSGIILENEGSIQKIQKRELFHYEKVKRAPLI